MSVRKIALEQALVFCAGNSWQTARTSGFERTKSSANRVIVARLRVEIGWQLGRICSEKDLTLLGWFDGISLAHGRVRKLGITIGFLTSHFPWKGASAYVKSYCIKHWSLRWWRCTRLLRVWLFYDLLHICSICAAALFPVAILLRLPVLKERSILVSQVKTNARPCRRFGVYISHG